MNIRTLLLVLASTCVVACSAGQGGTALVPRSGDELRTKQPLKAAENPFPVIHVFVALCDNVNQGIVPVSPSLGNGDDPATNLYWGAGFGVKSFFKKSKQWELLSAVNNPSAPVLERVVFKHKTQQVFMIADAYRGREIKRATVDFLAAAAGDPGEEVPVLHRDQSFTLNTAGSASLVVYVGHDGLMDFALPDTPRKRDDRKRDAIILACASKQYFSSALKLTGASPLLWTTNLMAPEAYVLSAAVDGWIKKDSAEQVRMGAAKAYHSYQNCGLRAASNLFATGW